MCMIHDKDYRDAEILSTPVQVLKAKHKADRKLVKNLS